MHRLREGGDETNGENGKRDSTAGTLSAGDFTDKIAYAFQLATAQGPLCSEPIQGIAVFLEEVTVSTSSDEGVGRDKLGRLTGEVIKTVRDSIRQGFLDWSPRMLLAMYSCEIQASSKCYVPTSPTSQIVLCNWLSHCLSQRRSWAGCTA